MKAIRQPDRFSGKEKATFSEWADDFKNYIAARDTRYIAALEEVENIILKDETQGN